MLPKSRVTHDRDPLAERPVLDGKVARLRKQGMKRALQAVEHADRAWCHLDPEVHAFGIETLRLGQDALPLLRREIALHQRHRTGPLGRSHEALDQ